MQLTPATAGSNPRGLEHTQTFPLVKWTRKLVEEELRSVWNEHRGIRPVVVGEKKESGKEPSQRLQAASDGSCRTGFALWRPAESVQYFRRMASITGIMILALSMHAIYEFGVVVAWPTRTRATFILLRLYLVFSYRVLLVTLCLSYSFVTYI